MAVKEGPDGFCAGRAYASPKELLLNLPTKPSNILIMSHGTRGDVQPFLAIAMGLKAKGYKVAILTNTNHKGIVEANGIECIPAYTDTDALIQNNEPLKEAMANGDMDKFFPGLNEALDNHLSEHCKNVMEALERFKPDFVVEGSLMAYWRFFCIYRLKIPTIIMSCTVPYCDPKRMCFGLPTLPFGLHRFIMSHLIIGGIYDGAKKQDAQMKEQYGYTVCDVYSKDNFIEGACKCPHLGLYGLQSPLFRDVLYPGAHPNYKLIGMPIIPSATQKQQSSNFGRTAEIEKFIASGKKPIYCGWGSMTAKTPEHMVELIARAAMKSQQRAIVLGGWASLGIDCLKKATQDASVVAYAEQNLLFVDTAAHEWLFPQVACTVHHGGAGTTNVALRAGVPTVITPVFLDQHDNAYLVEQLGVGVGLKKLQELTADELGDAITKAVDTPSIVANAEAFGKKIRAEDGVHMAVQAIETFWSDVILSGQFCMHIEKISRSNASWGWCSCAEGSPY